MDHVYEDRYHQLALSLKPSEFWRRQGYTTYQKEDVASFAVPLTGEDNVIWGRTIRTQTAFGQILKL